MEIDFQIIPYQSNRWQEAVHLRENVLRIPLGSTFSNEELEEEKDHIHIAGYLNDRLLVTAVLVPFGTLLKMQRVAVHEDYRNKNMGSQLLHFCAGYAKKNSFEAIFCHARDTAVNFYRKNAYSTIGDYFLEDGIPHMKMIKEF